MPEPGQYGVRLRGTRLDGAIHESLYDYIIDFKRPPKKRTKKEPTIKQEAETFDSTGKVLYLILLNLLQNIFEYQNQFYSFKNTQKVRFKVTFNLPPN